MATNQKLNECGWFYHAPERRKVATEPVEIPITSQIPGLSDLPPEFDDKPREMYFKDTDTKYIRLAKQGGRKDLLAFKDVVPKRREPRGYPRVNWFYLEDNAAEDAVEKQDLDWQFLLPEYMVHDQQRAVMFDETESVAHLKQGRAPYAFDSTTAFQREGDSITDKTVKLPEVRPHGYGVRINRPPPTKRQGPRDRSQKPPNASQPTAERHGRRRSAPKIGSSEVDMDKLLSYAYDKEWHTKLTKGQTSPCDKEDVSEYTENYRKLSAARREQAGDTNPTDRVTEQRKPAPASDRVRPKQQITEEKEPFKLSKFKNVPARIDTHQKPETQRSSLRKQD